MESLDWEVPVPVSVSAATTEGLHIWVALSLLYGAGRSLSVGVADAVAGIVAHCFSRALSLWVSSDFVRCEPLFELF